MIDYSLILSFNYPSSNWILSGDSYSGLQWLSDSPKPTQEELDALWPSTVEKQAKEDCKNKAAQILNSTDWTSIADVGDPAKSNPYLVNQAEFIAYRSTVRNYAVNPVVDPVWPTPPVEQWSN